MKRRMMIMKRKAGFFLLLLFLTMLAGCIQTQSIPSRAKTGETIILGLGGIHRNAMSNYDLTTNDLAATITDSIGNTYNLQVDVVFKVFQDHNSVLNMGTVTGIYDGLIFDVYDGGWFAVVSLTTANPRTPLPLAPGSATIKIMASDLLNTKFVPYEGDLDAIPIEIISGQVAWDSDVLQQFTNYRSYDRAFSIVPDDLAGVTEVSGAYFVVDYSDDALFSQNPIVVPVSHNPFVQLSYNVVANGNGTGSIYITLLNPAGFTTRSLRQDNASLLQDLGVRLQYFEVNGSNLDVVEASFTLDAGSSYYIDTNGDVIPSISPSMFSIRE
jgi:hypothetical protein